MFFLLVQKVNTIGWYGITYRVNDLQGFVDIYAKFVKIFPDSFYYLWSNFVDTANNFLLQGVGGRGHVGIYPRLQNNPKKKVQRS